MVVTPPLSLTSARPKQAGAALACLAGAAILLARPWLVRGVDHGAPVLVAVFVTIGVVGAWWPVATADAPKRVSTAVWVTAVGAGAFGVGRLLAGGKAAAPAFLGYVVLNSLAAVAEEALFRRLVYDALSRWGATVAIVGSAAAFAVVHVTVWGLW